jgi:hypothetical protein
MIDGVAQIVLTSALGTVGVTPSDGRVLWEHRWDNPGRYPVHVQDSYRAIR